MAENEPAPAAGPSVSAVEEVDRFWNELGISTKREARACSLHMIHAQMLDRLRAENFALAAGQCIVKDGLLGDEGGSPYCRIQRENEKLRAALETLRDAYLHERNGEEVSSDDVWLGNLVRSALEGRK